MNSIFFSLNSHNQDAVVELSEHGIVIIVEEISCLQAKVYLQREVLLLLFYFYTEILFQFSTSVE